jgi:hypothetical protein
VQLNLVFQPVPAILVQFAPETFYELCSLASARLLAGGLLRLIHEAIMYEIIAQCPAKILSCTVIELVINCSIR